MVDPIDDIARQARQGSVSAIIQVLNEKLADSGVRTRAMFDQGVLQLLCEAATPEQLEQPVLVPHVRQILESIRPRNVRRVNINSRIVREQQLLWLEEIKRDPHNLLWSEEITLAKPKFLQGVRQAWKDTKSDTSKATLPKASPARLAREKRQFWRGLIGGASLSVFLLLVGWAVYQWLHPKLSDSTQVAATGNQPAASPDNPASDPTPANNSANSVNPSADAPADTPAGTPADTPADNLASTTTSPVAAPVASTEDPFAQAVRLAEETVAIGRSAQTSAEWLELASRWQRASDLMNQVTPEDARYAVAQDRVALYRQNSETALEQAQKNRE